MAQDYRELLVWQRAIQLTACVYQLAGSLPKEEIYGLRSQMQRASVSIASNIAEGRGRLSPAEFRHFLGIAQGSTYELQTQITVARMLGLSDTESLDQAELLANEVSKMLGSFIQKLSINTRRNELAARS